MMKGSGPALAATLLALGLASALGADDAPDGSDAPKDESRTVAIGPGYQAGRFHRWIWGSDYRDLWTARFNIEVLNLQTFGGGLTPLFRVGGQETKGLAMKGKDGRDYTFRAIDKDPTEILPEQLRDTWARGVVQDQMAAQHPAAPFIVDELMAAAGILRTDQKLRIMPDDPALGEFRKVFAGLVGQVYEFPGAVSDKNPGFHGATELLKHEPFYKRIEASPDDRADVRAFLKARLLDLLIGDWDRHRDQWRWVKFPDNPLWQPLPDDRDQAFSRYEGLVLAVVRPQSRILQNYSDHYPGITGLTWNGWEQDRQFFAGLDRAAFRETAADLKASLTNEVIERAARRMPAEYFKIDGARLIHDLEGLRDRLGEEADIYYEHLADKVKVYLTAAPEYVEVRWLDDGDLEFKVFRRGPDGGPSGDAYVQRTLHKKETREVQIYLGGGEDKVVTLGKPGDIELRVIAGPGHAVVDDTKGGGTRFYETGKGELQPGPGSKLLPEPYKPPPTPKNAPWVPPRDWGRDTFFVPWLSYGSDLGVFTGVGVDTQAFGFRKDPYANRHVLRLGWSFGEETVRADYHGEYRRENTGIYATVYAFASGIESSRFFGYGNETTDGGDSNSDFYRVRQQQYSLTPALAIPLAKNLKLFIGPTVKFAKTTHDEDDTLINQAKPYGYGDFGEMGINSIVRLDSRVAATGTAGGGVPLRSMGYPRGGFFVMAHGLYWPKAWDVEKTFGSVEGSAAAYLTPGGNKSPTLALRAGGKKVFGDYPFFEAAYLGGGLGEYDITAGDQTVRGLQKHRYAGDANLFGNADLRIYVSRFRIFLPGEWGLLGFADTGRVYLEGETSDQWHTGYGGGLWFAWLDRANTLSFSYGRAEGHSSISFRGGFGF
jgi:hypothetical protein